jgi:hypothetical protein
MQIHIQLIPGVLSTRAKQPGHEVLRLRKSGAIVALLHMSSWCVQGQLYLNLGIWMDLALVSVEYSLEVCD